jgi:acetoin:2,6-dichlorophenolindophenol oxidoreductase subunit alpha
MQQQVRPTIQRELASDLLRSMVLIRVFEEKVDELIRSGEIVAPTHSYVGEEAIAAGICANLLPEDYVLSTHRNHGHCLAKGMEPWRMLAEMMGRQGAYCQGLGGDNHLGDASRHMLGGNNVVAGGMPLAAGVAYVQKYRQTGRVVVCFFGDGAINQGLFHETLNLASVIGVPVLFVLENNEYAISTHIERVSAGLPAVERVKAYNIETLDVDGNDVMAVYEVSRRLLEDIRATQRPAFLECHTYRLEAHWTGEWSGYRAREEVQARWDREPIRRFVETLVRDDVMTQAEIDGIFEEVRSQVHAAVETVSSQPLLTKDAMYEVDAR